MAASIRDIARRAGVAASTVSRVINGSQRYRISEETAQRVWSAVREMDYKVDHVARHIVRRRWHGDKTRGGLYRLAVVHPVLQNTLAASFYFDIMFGIQAGMLNRRLSMAGLFEISQLQDERILFQASDPAEVDGLLIVGQLTDVMKRRLRRRVKTCIALVDPGGPRLDSITFDHRQSIITMVRHLAGLGHRRIAYAGRKLNTQAPFQSLERTRGYCDAVKELKLDDDPELIISTAGALRVSFRPQIEAIMSIRPRPTAMVCASDRVCIEMIRGLSQAGVRVPEDMALGGFEDLDVAAMMIPRLTTMHAPRHELGMQAVDMLLNRIENPEAPIEHRILPTHLVVRESCGTNSAK